MFQWSKRSKHAGCCPGGYPAAGAANWVNFLELDNIFGVPLVHAETDGQTAWNFTSACTVATRDASYAQLSWVIRFKQGPGSFWDCSRNANSTWENVCAGGVWSYGVWQAYLRQYTTSNGHLYGANFSTNKAARTERILKLSAIASTVITGVLVTGELNYLDSARAYVEYVVLNFAFYFCVIGAVLLIGASLLPAVKRAG